MVFLHPGIFFFTAVYDLFLMKESRADGRLGKALVGSFLRRNRVFSLT